MPEGANRLESAWLVVENRLVPGEVVTVTAAGEKYALVFTAPDLSAAFLAGLEDEALGLATLETWVLKESYLTASSTLGVTRVMFDYARGKHDALSAPLEGLLELARARLSEPATGGRA